jgi:hypothetical protein
MMRNYYYTSMCNASQVFVGAARVSPPVPGGTLRKSRPSNGCPNRDSEPARVSADRLKLMWPNLAAPNDGVAIYVTFLQSHDFPWKSSGRLRNRSGMSILEIVGGL